jgi:Zn-dependent protease with chaperone function
MDTPLAPESLPASLSPLADPAARMSPRRPSFFYQLGLALVTVAMVLLPCIYIALTICAGYGVYYFATHEFLAIWNWHVRGRYGFVIMFICSVTPLLVGTIIVIFMIKPIFARRTKRMQPITLNPDHEPVFREFVHRICAIVGAPAPREIHFDCDVNASAGFRRGFLSFLGSDLVLTVGLPLMAGLSVRQLAGVIAHEFGHFTQGVGMRLSYVVRRVNHWFARVIYERDSWDAALEEWAASDLHWSLSIMLGCARAGVWFSRLILTGLMYIGHAFSSFLMRQMEYDADRCEVHVAGSDDFEATTLRLGELGATTNFVYHEMQQTWQTARRLPDNVPLLVGHHAARIPDEVRAKVAEQSTKEKTGWLDTHPSAADRIAAARRAAQPGLIAEDAPAPDLLANFATLGKFVTLAHYEDDLEIETDEDTFISVEAVLRQPEPVAPPPPESLPQAPRWQGPPVG